MTGKR